MGEGSHLRLVVEDDDGNRSVVAVTPGEVSLGRVAENTVVLAFRNISRRHAKLTLDETGRGQVEDLGSYNGVFVNGTRIQGTGAFGPGDLLRLGDVQLELRHGTAKPLLEEDTERHALLGHEGTEPDGLTQHKLADEATVPGLAPPAVPAGAAPAPAADAAPVPAPARRPAPGPRFKLLCLGAPRLGVAFELNRQEMVLGRTPDNDVVLDHPSISRQHVRFRYEDDGLWAGDAGSANGLLVNGKGVDRARVARGDVLDLGTVRLRLLAADEDPVLTAAEQARAFSEVQGAARGPKLGWTLTVTTAVAVGVCGALYLLRRGGPAAPVVAGATAERLAQAVAKGQQDEMAASGEAPDTAGNLDEARSLLGQAHQALASKQYARAGALANAVLAIVPDGGGASAKGALVAAAKAVVIQASDEGRGAEALANAKKAAANKDWPDAFNALQNVPKTSSFAAEGEGMMAEVRPALIRDRLQEARESADGHDWDEVELLLQEVDGLLPKAADEAEVAALRRTMAEGRKHGAGKGGGKAEAGGEARADAKGKAGHHGSTDDAKALYAEGTRLLGQGQYGRAIDNFNRCLVADKSFALCYRALGIAYAKGGSGSKAARFYRLYLKVEPNAADAAQVKGLLLQYQKSAG